jgi:drug/metabolite transporter, DME family
VDQRTKGIYATIIAAIIWSTAGLFIKLLTQDAFTILFYRSLFSATAFLVILGRNALYINKLTIIGALFYAPLIFCFVTSTKLTSAANAIFLQYAAPAYVLLLEPYLLKTKLKRIDILTVVLCIFGLLLFFMDQFEKPENWLGMLLAVFSGFMWTGLVLSQRKNEPKYQGGSIFYGNIIVIICMIPWFKAAPYPQGTELIYLLFLGFVQLGLGFILFTYGQRHIPAIDSSLIAMIEPLLNPVWVIIGYGEVPSMWAFIGGGVILSSLIVRMLWVRRKSLPMELN